jgi:hypothetical protein
MVVDGSVEVVEEGGEKVVRGEMKVQEIYHLLSLSTKTTYFSTY